MPKTTQLRRSEPDKETTAEGGQLGTHAQFDPEVRLPEEPGGAVGQDLGPDYRLKAGDLIHAATGHDVTAALNELAPGQRLAIGRAPESCALLDNDRTIYCKISPEAASFDSTTPLTELIVEKHMDGSLRASSLNCAVQSGVETRGAIDIVAHTPLSPGAAVMLRNIDFDFAVPNSASAIPEGALSPDPDPRLVIPLGQPVPLVQLLAANESLELAMSRYDTFELNKLIGVKVRAEEGANITSKDLMAALHPLASAEEPLRTVLLRDLTLTFKHDLGIEFGGGLKAAAICNVREILLSTDRGPHPADRIQHEAMHKLTIGDKRAFSPEMLQELKELHLQAIRGYMQANGMNPAKAEDFRMMVLRLDKPEENRQKVIESVKELGLDPTKITFPDVKKIAQNSYYSNIDECFAEMGKYFLNHKGPGQLAEAVKMSHSDRGKVLGSGHFDAFFDRYAEILASDEFRARALLRLTLGEINDRLEDTSSPFQKTAAGHYEVVKNNAFAREYRKQIEESKKAAEESGQPFDPSVWRTIASRISVQFEAERKLLRARAEPMQAILDLPLDELRRQAGLSES